MKVNIVVVKRLDMSMHDELTTCQASNSSPINSRLELSTFADATVVAAVRLGHGTQLIQCLKTPLFFE